MLHDLQRGHLFMGFFWRAGVGMLQIMQQGGLEATAERDLAGSEQD